MRHSWDFRMDNSLLTQNYVLWERAALKVAADWVIYTSNQTTITMEIKTGL